MNLHQPKIKIHFAFRFSLVLLLTSVMLSQCANKKDELESERALYEAAQVAMDNHQYDRAVEHFRKIELRFPFGRYAEQAQLESIYAYYQNDELAAANISADRFIRQYPDHPNLDYAYYLKALSNYHVDQSITSRFVNQASAKRDLTATKDAFRDFNALIRRFPDSDYAADAQKRMLYIRDLIAQQEITVANYYMQRAAYVAAVNRAKLVIENYPGTSANADALAIMVHAYQEMNLNELAYDSLKVLQHNFPDYEKLLADGTLAPYDRLYHDEVNWLNFISFGLLNKSAAQENPPASMKNEPDVEAIPRAPDTLDDKS